MVEILFGWYYKPMLLITFLDIVMCISEFALVFGVVKVIRTLIRRRKNHDE